MVHHCKITVGAVRINSWLSQQCTDLDCRCRAVFNLCIMHVCNCCAWKRINCCCFWIYRRNDVVQSGIYVSKFIHLHFILGRIPASNWPPTLKNRWLPESLRHRRHSTLALWHSRDSDNQSSDQRKLKIVRSSRYFRIFDNCHHSCFKFATYFKIRRAP